MISLKLICSSQGDISSTVARLWTKWWNGSKTLLIWSTESWRWTRLLTMSDKSLMTSLHHSTDLGVSLLPMLSIRSTRTTRASLLNLMTKFTTLSMTSALMASPKTSGPIQFTIWSAHTPSRNGSNFSREESWCHHSKLPPDTITVSNTCLALTPSLTLPSPLTCTSTEPGPSFSNLIWLNFHSNWLTKKLTPLFNNFVFLSDSISLL